MSGTLIVSVTGLILLRGLMSGTDVYEAFLRGAGRGMKAAFGLLPALCAVMLMIGVMNASGLTEAVARAVSPVMRALNLPEEIVPVILLRPLTGSGSLAALEQIMHSCGPDSRAARIAAVIVGSGETVMYTMSVYGSAAGMKNLPGVFVSAMTGYAISVASCGLFIR